MIRIHSQKQMTLEGFETPFEREMDKNNRWVKLSDCMPWDALADAYYQSFSIQMGRPAKDARLVIGAVIIKHKLKLSDEETVCMIQENPYLQYFCGLKSFQTQPPFAPSLFVEIRRRMGTTVFEQFHQAIVDQLEGCKRQEDDQEPPASGGDGTAHTDTNPNRETEPTDEKPVKTHQGRLIVDATVAEQAIRFPTDLSLLNESREISERLIDALYPHSGLSRKPRTYRQKARTAYLDIAKQRRPSRQKRRHGIKQQLQYLRRNLNSIDTLLDNLPDRSIPLTARQLRQYWVIQHVYRQQAEMYRHKSRRCDDRIVSIHQPHVRPIIRGKAHKTSEFGAKLSVSLTGSGLARVDRISWDAFNESGDFKSQVEAYKTRYGAYPESVHADPVYGTRENRKYLKDKGILYAGKPLGRPPKVTEQNAQALKQAKRQRQADYRQRIPIEGKFGQGKNGYSLNYIRARTARTSEAWINSIFFVMNLLVLIRHFLVPEIMHRMVMILERLMRRILKYGPISTMRFLQLPIAA